MVPAEIASLGIFCIAKQHKRKVWSALVTKTASFSSSVPAEGLELSYNVFDNMYSPENLKKTLFC